MLSPRFKSNTLSEEKKASALQSTKITEGDNYGVSLFSGSGMSELETRCKFLSLRKTGTSISRSKYSVRDPLVKLEEKVEQLQMAIKQKEKAYARKINKLKRKLQSEEDAQYYLVQQVKTLNREAAKNSEAIRNLQEEVSPVEKGKRSSLKAPSRMFKKPIGSGSKLKNLKIKSQTNIQSNKRS